MPENKRILPCLFGYIKLRIAMIAMKGVAVRFLGNSAAKKLTAHGAQGNRPFILLFRAHGIVNAKRKCQAKEDENS